MNNNMAEDFILLVLITSLALLITTQYRDCYIEEDQICIIDIYKGEGK